MVLSFLEEIVQWIGGLAVSAALAVILYGIWRGLGQPVGRTTGKAPGLLRSTTFYVFASIGYFGLGYLLWRPIPLSLTYPLRILFLLVGALLFFPGLATVLWGRLTLGNFYFVSTSLAAQLYTGHRLITHGPYALVRHPMYLGLLMTGMGGVLIYRTWTFIFITLTFLGLIARSRREEQVLAAEFGEQWLDYTQRTPPWIPKVFSLSSLRRMYGKSMEKNGRR